MNTVNGLNKHSLLKLREDLDKVAKAAQTNDELLVDGVRNLELRVNMAMAIMSDFLNQTVRTTQQEGNPRLEIDLDYYYTQYMQQEALKEQQRQMTEKALEEVAKDYPEDTVVFGGDK